MKSEMSLNIVVGLSGVGKGTVLEEAQLLSDTDYKTVNFGDKMMETAEEHGVESRGEMKELETEPYREIQREAAEKIFEMDGEVIVDTHAAILTPHGYIPGLPKWIIEELNPDKIIMVTAAPQEIWERTQEDDRNREHSSPEEIGEYQETAKQMAATDAVLTGAYFKKIENHDGEVEKAAEELLETLQA